ncbi:MAG: LUD domain-containing protein [Ruminococcus sp.]|nr:LUD domain-containing protein [Ruminococcus sp.]
MAAVENVIKALEKNGYEVKFFSKGTEAVQYLVEKIQNQTVGFGGSGTLAQLGLHEKLAEKNVILDADYPEPGETFRSTARKSIQTDCYLLSANGLSEDGIIVNLDGEGNRIASSVYGHKKVYYVIGTNKIEKDLERTIWRVRNVAAPKNAALLKVKTPCAKKGDRCYDCDSPERICKGLLINLKKIDSTEVEVILVDEPLGF